MIRFDKHFSILIMLVLLTFSSAIFAQDLTNPAFASLSSSEDLLVYLEKSKLMKERELAGAVRFTVETHEELKDIIIVIVPEDSDCDPEVDPDCPDDEEPDNPIFPGIFDHRILEVRMAQELDLFTFPERYRIRRDDSLNRRAENEMIANGFNTYEISAETDFEWLKLEEVMQVMEQPETESAPIIAAPLYLGEE